MNARDTNATPVPLAEPVLGPVSRSGIPVPTAVGPDAVKAEHIGKPGEYPFTRGIFPDGYQGRLWTIRQYSGFGTAKQTNQRFHYLLELSGGDIDDYEGGGYEGEVLKCDLSYVAVSGFNANDSGRRRVTRGEVWFALMPDTTFAPPVRISTPLSAGGATIRLASFRRALVDVQYSTTDATTTP